MRRCSIATAGPTYHIHYSLEGLAYHERVGPLLLVLQRMNTWLACKIREKYPNLLVLSALCTGKGCKFEVAGELALK